LFWFLVAGAPGALLYRLNRNLKQLWHRDAARYREFGWAAAELDDILGLVPAWLTAASFALLGASRQAWTCWRQQAGTCADANAGILLASAGGALGLKLRVTPPLGTGAPPEAGDVARAETLARRTLLLWLGLLAAAGLAWWLLERHMPHHTRHWHDLMDTLRGLLVD
jgi:adenosylcobinamide-phosphate synthase